jgi:hypothetical protein
MKTTTLLLRLSILAMLIVACYTQGIDYSPFRTSVLVPFDYSEDNAAVPFTWNSRISLRVGTGSGATTHNASIDTGTCGWVLSTDRFPNWDAATAATYPEGWQYLSSSKRLYSGHWIPQPVTFLSTNVEVTATIPILVVEDVAICSSYDSEVDTNVCPTPTNTTTSATATATVTHLPTGISLLGIGFGRQKDGQPQGNPDKNLLLNIDSINGVDVPSSYRNGYIISADGITLGLTAANTADFSFTKLLPGRTADPRDWAPLPVCISVDGSLCVNGTALIDTGIAQSYLTVPSTVAVQRHQEASLSTGNSVWVLNNGSVVDVKLGSAPDFALEMAYVVGEPLGVAEGIVPAQVITTVTSAKDPYVNTGRHFFRGWRIAYDAVEGWYGFSKVEEEY